MKELFPDLCLATFSCTIRNPQYNSELWNLIQGEIDAIKEKYKDFSAIKTNKRIQATRQAYKKLGKDPNRYRPSAESLMRRIIKGNGLYQVNTAVDLINLVSLRSGFSIGAFDAARINGNLIYSLGRKKDPFKGIGRGPLNIENLPVLFDEKGGIGTPTSDEERTALRVETHQLFVNVNAYTGEEDVKDTLEMGIQLCEQFLNAQNIDVEIVR